MLSRSAAILPPLPALCSVFNPTFLGTSTVRDLVFSPRAAVGAPMAAAGARTRCITLNTTLARTALYCETFRSIAARSRHSCAFITLLRSTWWYTPVCRELGRVRLRVAGEVGEHLLDLLVRMLAALGRAVPRLAVQLVELVHAVVQVVAVRAPPVLADQIDHGALQREHAVAGDVGALRAHLGGDVSRALLVVAVQVLVHVDEARERRRHELRIPLVGGRESRAAPQARTARTARRAGRPPRARRRSR